MKKKIIATLACGLLVFHFMKVDGLTELNNKLGISFESSESTKFNFSFVDDPILIMSCADFDPIQTGPGVGIIRRRVCVVPGGENCTVQYVHVGDKVGDGGTCLIFPE